MSEPSKLSKRLERTRQKIELLQAQRQLRMLESFERGQRLPVRLPKAQQNLQESSSEAWQWVSGYQDVIDRFNGTDRDFIFPFSTAMDRRYGENWPFWRTWQEHARLRAASRLIWTLSPLASGAISALTSYVVGEGMQTKIAGKDKDVAKELVAAVQAVVDSIIDRNDWMTMQQECFTRARRDGEFFLRDFPQDDGMTLFRIVDPEQIMEPPGMSREEASFGIITDPDDLLDIRGYWWAPRGVPSFGEYLPSSDVLHVKENVDGIIKRGLPDFAFDTQQLYKTVNRLLINMGQGASIQSAIAFVRQHKNVDTASIEAFVNAQGDYSETRPFTGVQQTIQRLEGGSVIDMDANQDFVKSPGADNVSGFTQVVQALLRAVATRWNAPEWIVSADASNNNMASSMVAESPFVKTCKRFQHRYARAFKHVIAHALRHYCRVRGGLRVGMSKYTWATLSQLIDVQVVPPTVETRDRQQEAMVNRTYVELGVKSRKTIATELGLDWDAEQQNNDEYDKAHPQGGQDGTGGGNPLAAMMSGSGDQPPGDSPPDEPQPPDNGGGDDNTNQPPQDDNEDFSDLEGFLDSIDLNESRRSTLNQFADTEIHSTMHTQILFDPAKTIFSEGEWVNSVLNQPTATPLIESRQTSSLTELEAFASQLPVDERLSYIRQALLEGRGIDKLGRVICWNDKGKRIPCNQEKSETSHKDRQRANEGLQKLMAAPHAVTPKDAESVAKALKHLAHDELAALKKQHGLRASGKKEELINRLVGAASKILTQRQQYERQARAEGVPPAYVNSIAQQNYKIGAGYVREARKLIWAARDYYEGMTGKKLRIMRANGRMDPSSIPELELIARGLKTQYPGFLNPDEMADDTENARVLFDLLVTGGPAMPDRGEMYKQAIEQAKYEAKKAEDDVPFDMEGLGDEKAGETETTGSDIVADGDSAAGGDADRIDGSTTASGGEGLPGGLEDGGNVDAGSIDAGGGSERDTGTNRGEVNHGGEKATATDVEIRDPNTGNVQLKQLHDDSDSVGKHRYEVAGTGQILDAWQLNDFIKSRQGKVQIEHPDGRYTPFKLRRTVSGDITGSFGDRVKRPIQQVETTDVIPPKQGVSSAVAPGIKTEFKNVSEVSKELDRLRYEFASKSADTELLQQRVDAIGRWLAVHAKPTGLGAKLLGEVGELSDRLKGGTGKIHGTRLQITEPEPGFTGTDALGREWRNGKLVAAKEEVGDEAATSGGEVSDGGEKVTASDAESRKWKKNDDGTYTSPDGTVWRKAKAGGEHSPVNSKFFQGGWLMPIHGKSSVADKSDAVGGDGGVKVGTGGQKSDDAPKNRGGSYTPREPVSPEVHAENARRQSMWDDIKSGPLAQLKWLGDQPNGKALSDRNIRLDKWKEFADTIGSDQVGQLKEVLLPYVIDHWKAKFEEMASDPVHVRNREAFGAKPMDVTEEVQWHVGQLQDRALEAATSTPRLNKQHLKSNPDSFLVRELVSEAIGQAQDNPSPIDSFYDVSKMVQLFTGTDALGREWINGKLKPVQDDSSEQTPQEQEKIDAGDATGSTGKDAGEHGGASAQASTGKEAEAEERVGGSDPDVMPGDFNPALHLNIAADSPERLRKADVFRVLEWAPPEHLAVMAEWLQGKRPDLKEEIDSALLDIEEERGSNPASPKTTSSPDVTTTPTNVSQSTEQPFIKRSKDSIRFASPIVGPSGAELLSYDWRFTEIEEPSGDEVVTRKISDWDQAEQNLHTGRNVVHQFHVKTADGKEHLVSLESALSLLGYGGGENPSSAKIRTLASNVKALARKRIELEISEKKHQAYLDAIAKADEQVKSIPQPSIEKTAMPSGAVMLRMGDAKVIDPSGKGTAPERINTLLSLWRDKRRAELLPDDVKGYDPVSGHNKIETLQKQIVSAEKKVNGTAESQPIDASASNPTPPSPGFSGRDDNGHCWDQGKMIPCPDESPSATLPASAASEPSSTELTKSEIIRNNQNNIDNSSAGDTISGREEVKTQPPEEPKMSQANFQPIPHTKGQKGVLVIRGDTKAIKSELSTAKWKWQPDRKVWQLDMPAPYADKIREGGDVAKEWIKNLNGFKKGVLITLDGYIVFKSKEYTGEIAGIYPGNNGKEDPANTPRVDVEAILQPLGLKAIGSPQEFTKSLTGKDQGLSHIGREFSVDGKKYVTVEAGQPYHISGDAAESSGQKPGWKQKHLSVEIQEFSPEKQRADKIAELEQKIKMYEFPSDDDRGEPQRLETLKQLKKELASQNSNSSSSASVETSRIDVQPVEVQPEKKMSLIKITGKTFPHKEEIKIASDGTAKFDDDGWIVPADVADKLRDLPGLEFNIAPPQLEGSEYDVMSAKQTYKAFLEYTKTYADVILRQNHASAVEFYPALKENPYDSLTWKAIADKLEESGDAKLTRAIPGIRAIATVLQHKDAAWWLQHKGQDSKTIIKSVM